MARVQLTLLPGVDSVDTSYAEEGRFRDNSNSRFWLGKPQAIGGWQSVLPTLLTGVCRSLLAWTDNTGLLNIAAGTHSNLQIIQDSILYDITPNQGFVSVSIAAGGSGYTSASIAFPAAPSGYITATGTVIVTGGAITEIIITNPGHYPSGVLAAPVLTGSGGSGGSLGTAVVASFAPGNIDALLGGGYGAGPYSTGDYSAADNATSAAMTWSLASWGQNLMACARGGPIWWWQNTVTTPAQALTSDAASNAPGPPQEVSYMLTTPQRTVLAVGCNQGYSTGTSSVPGPYNPLCIRESDVEDPTDWNPTSTNLSSETVLDGSGRLVAARVVGLDVVLAWTDTGLYSGSWTGETSQPRQWTLVSTGCGLIGPNAAVVVGQVAYWMDPSNQIWSYAVGGAPIPYPCPILEELTANLAHAQTDKIVASHCVQFQEIRFGYPDVRDSVPGASVGLENSRALCMSLITSEQAEIAGSTMIFWWDRLARSAYLDARPSPYPLSATPTGNLYYQEMGATADGSAFDWYFESADQYLNDSQQVMYIGGFWPDFQDQQGPVNVTIFVRQYPQSPEVAYGPYACAPPSNGFAGTSKIDFRISGRLARIRFEGNSAPTAGRLGLPAFDIEPAGAR